MHQDKPLHAVKIIAMLFFCLLVYVPFYGQNNSQSCTISALPSVQFRSNSAKLLPAAQAALKSAANELKANPACKVKVAGYGDMSKKGQQLSWDHVNAVITYLVEELGISRDRCIFNYGMSGDPTIVDLVPTVEDGPGMMPAPAPNLRRIN